MPRSLAALKVRIGRRTDGSADYPNFNLLPVVQASGRDWSKYIDVEGEGWMYDRKSRHDDEDAESPYGVQDGLLLVTEQFAIEAVAQFPSVCTRLTEAEAEAFYDQRVAIEEQDELEDEDVLQKLERKLRLLKELQGTPEEPTGYPARLIAIRQQIADAIDPSTPARGVRDNPRATMAKLKAARSITITE